MSYDSEVPDPLHAWHKVLERLYHGDHILYARMNSFFTVPQPPPPPATPEERELQLAEAWP
jgi:hypothetical protein